KFVKRFSQIVAPLTSLTNKDAFNWSKSAHVAFEELKKETCSCPVLAVLDFSRPFELACDASGEGIGAVLMQNQHPIAFGSRKLKEYEKKLSIYDKEMLAIMHALIKFRKYLICGRFVVKTDHNSLRLFLHQKELNDRQQRW
ncbi:hypothetical protein KI387_035294, partial [Taxus chinensis]